jgi:hypothetical protein
MYLIIWHCFDSAGKFYTYFTTIFEGGLKELRTYLQKEPIIPQEAEKSVNRIPKNERRIVPISICRVPVSN